MSSDEGTPPQVKHDHRLAKRVLTPERTYLEILESPIPHPEIVERYNAIHPELGTDIIRNFNSEVGHRRTVELEKLAQQRLSLETLNENQRVDRKNRSITLYAVLLFVVGALVFGGVLIWNERPVQGWAIIIAQVATLIAAGYHSNRNQK